MDWAKNYHSNRAERQQQRRDMLKNQSDYYKKATAKNEEWRLFGRTKNTEGVGKVKGTAKAKVLRLWKSGDTIDGVQWTRQKFMKVISNVASGTDPVYSMLMEMISGLGEYDNVEMLSVYVKEIWDVLNVVDVDNDEMNENEE